MLHQIPNVRGYSTRQPSGTECAGIQIREKPAGWAPAVLHLSGRGRGMQDRELTDDTGPVRQPERRRPAFDAPLKRPEGNRVALHPFTSEYVRKLTAGDADVELHFVEYFSSLLLVK